MTRFNLSTKSDRGVKYKMANNKSTKYFEKVAHAPLGIIALPGSKELGELVTGTLWTEGVNS
jgi:hypothetical protein